MIDVILKEKVIAPMSVGAIYTFFNMLYIFGYTAQKYLLRSFVLWQIIFQSLHMMDGGPIASIVFVWIHFKCFCYFAPSTHEPGSSSGTEYELCIEVRTFGRGSPRR